LTTEAHGFIDRQLGWPTFGPVTIAGQSTRKKLAICGGKWHFVGASGCPEERLQATLNLSGYVLIHRM